MNETRSVFIISSHKRMVLSALPPYSLKVPLLAWSSKTVVSWKELRSHWFHLSYFLRGKEEGRAQWRSFLVHADMTFDLMITPEFFQLPNTASNTCIHFCRHVPLTPVSAACLWPWEQGPWQSGSAWQTGGSTRTPEWMNRTQYLKLN